MFTTPCFIRKNTFELRKKLSDLGYSQVKQAIYYNHIMVENGNIWLCQEVFNPQNPNGKGWKDCINCGTNEDLFLAVSALRNDIDKYQWFADDKFAGSQRFAICEQNSWKEHFNRVTGDCGSYKDWHKATVEELIEHFK